MALQTSASGADPLLMSEARTEFGLAGTVYLTGFRIGSGNVANHENNYTSPAAIPSSGTIKLLNLLGSDKDFESNAWTRGSSITYSTTCYTSFTFSQNFRAYGYTGVGATYGTKGSIDVAGMGKSNTVQATITGVYNYNDSTNGTTYYDWAYLYFSGDKRGTWWTSATVNGSTKTRASASTTSGSFDGTNTYWLWNSPAASSGWTMPGADGNTFTFNIVL